MRLLIDTRVLLWWTILAHENRLNAIQLETISNPDFEIVVSYVTAWEMAIKQSIKKLELPAPAEDFVRFEAQDKNLRLLPVTLDHIGAYEKLPLNHRDPFDRMLAAQANVEGLRLMTSDKNFDKLGIKRYW